MSEHITSDGVFNIYDFVDKYVERVSRVIDEMALEKLERELAEYGYVKVVRCRDCANPSFDEFGGGWCNENCREVKPWDYCAWAKRKEGK